MLRRERGEEDIIRRTRLYQALDEYHDQRPWSAE